MTQSGVRDGTPLSPPVDTVFRRHQNVLLLRLGRRGRSAYTLVDPIDALSKTVSPSPAVSITDMFPRAAMTVVPRQRLRLPLFRQAYRPTSGSTPSFRVLPPCVSRRTLRTVPQAHMDQADEEEEDDAAASLPTLLRRSRPVSRRSAYPKARATTSLQTPRSTAIVAPAPVATRRSPRTLRFIDRECPVVSVVRLVTPEDNVPPGVWPILRLMVGLFCVTSVRNGRCRLVSHSSVCVATAG